MPLPDAETYTSEDYWNLPDGRRAELIDGELYDMAPPSRVHQGISMGLSLAFGTYVAQREGACRVYAAPFAVNLDADDATWVEPDLAVVCDAGKLSDRGCEGAPDLVVEIVSPRSRRMDYITKTFRYERAGVREYWIVDPTAGHTTVYRFEAADPSPRVYPFDAPVPVGIWGDLAVTIGEFAG